MVLEYLSFSPAVRTTTVEVRRRLSAFTSISNSAKLAIGVLVKRVSSIGWKIFIPESGSSLYLGSAAEKKTEPSTINSLPDPPLALYRRHAEKHPSRIAADQRA